MTMRISQNMGYVDTGGGNGAVGLPSPPAGKQLYFVIVPLVDLQREKGKRPAVSLVGTTLSWSYSPGRCQHKLTCKQRWMRRAVWVWVRLGKT